MGIYSRIIFRANGAWRIVYFKMKKSVTINFVVAVFIDLMISNSDTPIKNVKYIIIA